MPNSQQKTYNSRSVYIDILKRLPAPDRPMTLSQSQINSYKRDGYLVLERIIPEEMLHEIRNIIDAYIEQSRQVTASNKIFDIDPSHTADAPMVRRLKDPHLRHPVFKQLAEWQPVIDVVAQLLDGTVRFDHSKLNFKHPDANAEIKWHQDWAFYPHTNDDILAMGVMIEDCTTESGPLMVIPGSHRGPVFDHHHNGVFAGGIPDNSIAHLLDSAVELVAPAGSITLHHVRTLHGSRNCTQNTARPLLLFSYTAVDAFPIFQQYDLAEYDARILRGEPVKQGRMEALPFRIHLPQKDGADSIYDDQEAMR